MILDLTQGFGDFDLYLLTKFPDNSIKFILKIEPTEVESIKTTLRSSDDILTLLLVNDVIPNKPLYISYMMYQQDDRKFAKNESFGLKVISNLINTTSFNPVIITAPHSDKVEFINNVTIVDNTNFISNLINNELPKDFVWIIPDSGAFKTQMKQLQALNHKEFLVCSKMRAANGELTQVVNTGDLQGKPCVIFDDICLGGRTFLGIASELRKHNCGDIYLAVTHGVFNYGIDHLKEFKHIYTTDSICTLQESENFKIIKL